MTKAMTRHIITIIGVWILTFASANAQSELTVDWSIYEQDTVIPTFTYHVDLGYDHAGRQHNVSIEYPELVPLTTEETKRFHLPAKAGLPDWPVIESYKGISAKRGQLDISFTPIIWRDGQYQKIINFTLKVESIPLTSKAHTRISSQESPKR